MLSFPFLFLTPFLLGTLAPATGLVVPSPMQRFKRAAGVPAVFAKKQQEMYGESDSYHKGGNAHFLNPEVYPARLDDGEDCDEPFIDHATGDELCWGDAPTHPKNFVRDSTKKVPEEKVHVNFEVIDDYHKGGDAHYNPVRRPRKLKENEDCDEENQYIDFETGDQLCWSV